MKVIIKHPHERIGRIKEVPNTLSALQRSVDGHIEKKLFEQMERRRNFEG